MENIYKKLNNAIEYIEKDLFEEKDIKKICQLLELNSPIANSIFELFTGYTIKDYIRKRRLSEAVFLLNKDRIIDVAITCGYNTREGFSRAFRAFHGMNPSNCLKSFNYLERIYFNQTQPLYPPINIEFKDLPQKSYYGRVINLPYSEFAKNKENNILEILKELGEKEGFIIFKKVNDKIIITITSEKVAENKNEVILPKGRYIESDKVLFSYAFPNIISISQSEIKYLYKME